MHIIVNNGSAKDIQTGIESANSIIDSADSITNSAKFILQTMSNYHESPNREKIIFNATSILENANNMRVMAYNILEYVKNKQSQDANE